LHASYEHGNSQHKMLHDKATSYFTLQA